MKKLYLALFLIYSFETFGQPNFKRLQIGITASPDYNLAIFGKENAVFSNDPLKNFVSPAFGYRVGTNLIWGINRKISFETGVFYSKKIEKDMFLTGLSLKIFTHSKFQ